MDTMFMYSENRKTAELHILTLKLTNKLYLRRGKKSIVISNLSFYDGRTKSLYSNNKFKMSAPTWNDKLSYPMDHFMYQ